MKMKPIYIFDLDGTLADGAHRLHYIQQEPKRWGEEYLHILVNAMKKRVVTGTSIDSVLGGAA